MSSTEESSQLPELKVVMTMVARSENMSEKARKNAKKTLLQKLELFFLLY